MSAICNRFKMLVAKSANRHNHLYNPVLNLHKEYPFPLLNPKNRLLLGQFLRRTVSLRHRSSFNYLY